MAHSLARSLAHVVPLGICRERYKKAPSFFSMHMGIEAGVCKDKNGKDIDCHHVIVNDWSK